MLYYNYLFILLILNCKIKKNLSSPIINNIRLYKYLNDFNSFMFPWICVKLKNIDWIFDLYIKISNSLNHSQIFKLNFRKIIFKTYLCTADVAKNIIRILFRSNDFYIEERITYSQILSNTRHVHCCIFT